MHFERCAASLIRNGHRQRPKRFGRMEATVEQPRQLNLLAAADEAARHERISPQIHVEITNLLKILIGECVDADANIREKIDEQDNG